MDNKNKPAFSVHPNVTPTFDDHDYSGLSKREYFAGRTMQGLLASWGNHVHDYEELASDAVKAADALLTALESNKNIDK